MNWFDCSRQAACVGFLFLMWGWIAFTLADLFDNALFRSVGKWFMFVGFMAAGGAFSLHILRVTGVLP